MMSTAVAFVVALVLGSVARRVGPALGAMDRPDDAIKVHVSSVPWLGGAAVLGGLAAGLAVEGWPLPWAAGAAIGGAFALGLADDARNVPPPLRLAVQIGLGLLLAAGGLAADALPGAVLAWTGAALLFAATLNAVNMLDGMDGLAGGAAVLSALGLALAAARAGHDGAMTVALVTAAAAAGFLVHNLPPARLFLGDNGAYTLAAVLAVLVLAQARTAAGLVGAATCLGVFLVDLLLAIARRAVGGVPITSGDRGHLYDQLRARGLSRWGTLAVCWILHVAFIAVGVRVADTTTAVAVTTVAAAWAVALAWLLWSGLVTSGRVRR